MPQSIQPASSMWDDPYIVGMTLVWFLALAIVIAMRLAGPGKSGRTPSDEGNSPNYEKQPESEEDRQGPEDSMY